MQQYERLFNHLNLPAQHLAAISGKKNKDTRCGNVSLKISKGRSAYKRSGDEGLNPAESSERSHSCAKSLEEEEKAEEVEEERGKEKQAERDARRSGRTTNSLVGLCEFISLSSFPAF